MAATVTHITFPRVSIRGFEIKAGLAATVSKPIEMDNLTLRHRSAQPDSILSRAHPRRCGRTENGFDGVEPARIFLLEHGTAC
jgi:hypothetical protein